MGGDGGVDPGLDPDLTEAIRDMVDGLASAYAQPPWEDEIARAREEHDAARGRIFDDDELFDLHMASFLEWYVLERPLPSGQTPAAEAASQGTLDGEIVEAAERELLGALVASQRSLFEVLRLRSAAILVHDLIRGGRWLVDWTPAGGVARGDVFEARLVPWRGGVRLGPVVLFHPRVAHQQINVLLDTWRRRGELELSAAARLAEMRLRFSRFRNIAVEHIYRVGSG